MLMFKSDDLVLIETLQVLSRDLCINNEIGNTIHKKEIITERDLII